jgi:hypothetical protein
MGRVETEWLATEAKLDVLINLHGRARARIERQFML